MPAPIVIRNLTPETKKAANPEPGDPLIATKAELRDGSRAIGPAAPAFTLSATSSSITATITEGNGATSYEIRVDSKAAVSGLTVSGLNAGQTYSVQVRGIDANGTGPWSAPVSQATPASGEIDYIGSIVQGPAPTIPNGAYDISNLTYLGAFKIDRSTAGNNATTAYNTAKIAVRPPDGSNGAMGSIYCDSHVYFLGIGEFEIPTTLSQSMNPNDLPNATVLQPFVSMDTLQPNTNGHTHYGALSFDGQGRLLVGAYKFYDADGSGNPESLLVVENPTDLANSPTIGWLETTGQDAAGSYISEIPSEWQSQLGGTHLAGNAQGMSIVTRTSRGPSLFGFNPSDIVSADTFVPMQENMSFKNQDMGTGHYMLEGGGADAFNERTTTWYEDQIGMTFDQWVVGSQSPYWTELTPPSYDIQNNLWMRTAAARNIIIVPGTNTALAIGTMSGVRFGSGYKVDVRSNGNTQSNGEDSLFTGDLDHYYWAFDINDIVSATNPYDPRPYDFGEFGNSRWLIRDNVGDTTTGGIGGVAYDRANDRLYVAMPHYKWGSDRPTIVAVYSLGVQ